MNRPLLGVAVACLTAVNVSAVGDSGRPEAVPEAVVVQLVAQADPGLLSSRLNPPRLSLRDPFREGALLRAEVVGASAEGPESYYAHIDPAVWRLTVPPEAAPGGYATEIHASFALCSKARGFCFTEARTAKVTVEVGDDLAPVEVVMRLSSPK